MCVLCTDTFSRSDILKRHFQKCSVRRGNPTGASHLSNPAAHLKKSTAAAQKAAAAAASAAAAQGPTSQPGGQQSNNHTPASSSGVQPSPYATSMPGSSMPTTSTSLPAMNSMPFANGSNENKPPMGQQEHGGNANWPLHNGRQMMYAPSNTASPAQGEHHVENDWNQFLPPTGNENYMGQMYGYGHPHGDVKNESHESGQNGYYMPSTSLGADGMFDPLLNQSNSTHENPMRLKMECATDFYSFRNRSKVKQMILFTKRASSWTTSDTFSSCTQYVKVATPGCISLLSTS